MLATDTTPTIVYTINPTGLPNTELLIIQNDSMASDGFGPRIVLSTSDGRVVPSDYGFSNCNEICVLPFSYDLSQLQLVVALVAVVVVEVVEPVAAEVVEAQNLEVLLAEVA